MNVGIVGTGPAADAVRAALDDTSVTTESVDPEAIDTVDCGIVVGDSGAESFEHANDHARESETPWLAIERGGVGGRDLCEASVAGFGPETACYECLCRRVEANADDESSEDDLGESEANESGPDATTAWLAGALAGTEARRLCAGEPSRVLGGVIELPHAERRVLPVPNCGCAGDENRDRALARDFEERDLDDALARAELALDDRVGIVREVGEAASYPAPYYLARTGDTAGFSDGIAASEAAGVAGGWDRAFMKALGEALERYSAGVYRNAAFTHAVASDLPAAISPSSFVLPESAETGHGSEESDDEALPWVPGENLDSGASVHLPAEFVQFPPPERRHGPPITTGLGLGSSGAAALCSGLYEVIERDAAMVSWYSTFDPLGLAVDDEGFATLAARARSEGLDVQPVLLTQDVDVPVIALAVESDEWPRLAVGSAADLDPAAAARSALAEALQNWRELRAMGPDAAVAAEGAIGEYAESPGVAAEFFDTAQRVPAASVGPDPAPTGADELGALVERVTDAGLDPYAARLTPRDVEQLGFEAVRVLVPEAQPLFTDEPYFGERARTVPRESGFEPRLDREFHPYP